MAVLDPFCSPSRCAERSDRFAHTGAETKSESRFGQKRRRRLSYARISRPQRPSVRLAASSLALFPVNRRLAWRLTPSTKMAMRSAVSSAPASARGDSVSAFTALCQQRSSYESAASYDSLSDASSQSQSPPPSPTAWTSDLASDDSNSCPHPGCTNAVRSRGVCPRHGRETRCSVTGCGKHAASEGLCVGHGGGWQCTHSDCSSSAVSRGLCVQHGGGRICKHEGCSKHVASGGLCRAHGGGRRCKIPDCMSSAQSRGLCYVHGGGGRCQQLGCASSAKKGGYCIAHGGGHRCRVQGCSSSAVSGDLCRAHGGGKRCAVPDCKSSAKTGGLCIAHGGGKRCTAEGCKSSAQRIGLCKAHGGGRKCVTPGCVNSAVSRGKCIAHGGGKRCIHEGCSTTARRGGYCFAHGGRAPAPSASTKRLVGDPTSRSGSGSKRARSQLVTRDERMVIRKPGVDSVAPMLLTPKPTPGLSVGLPMTPPVTSQPLRPRLPSLSLLLSKQDSVRETECIPPIRSGIPPRRYSSDLADDAKTSGADTVDNEAKLPASDSAGYSWRRLQETVMQESKAEGLDSETATDAKNGAAHNSKKDTKSPVLGQQFVTCA